MADEEIEVFRAEVARLRGARKQGAPPYSADMIARARGVAERLEGAGQTRARVAAQLGIAHGTLTKWMTGPGSSRMSKATGAFRRVTVAKPPTAPTAKVQDTTVDGIRLISPRGYQVTGIDAATVVAILREVG